MYFVAVTPNPPVPSTTNILIVDLTMLNCPYISFERILAHNIPDNKIRNLAMAIPVNDHKIPDFILCVMSEEIEPLNRRNMLYSKEFFIDIRYCEDDA